MSIFFDFDVGPSGKRLRRAVEEDKYDIERFLNREHTVPLFGDADIGALMLLQHRTLLRKYTLTQTTENSKSMSIQNGHSQGTRNMRPGSPSPHLCPALVPPSEAAQCVFAENGGEVRGRGTGTHTARALGVSVLYGHTLSELSTLAICLINDKKEVTGFMALGDHPAQVVIDAADWEIWIRNMFNRFYLSRNTLFIHFVCCIDEVIEYFMVDALTSVFINDAYLNNILLLVPKGCPEECYKKYNVFRGHPTFKYGAKRVGRDNIGMFMFQAMSDDFRPKLKLRRAVEEDNDEIVEILDKKCQRLKELYGEYYVAELVGHHPETKRRIIVAEQTDRSVAGMMCLNSDINYEKLQKTYDLRPFYGLIRATPLERERLRRANKLLDTFGEPIMRGTLSPFSRMVKLETRPKRSKRKKSMDSFKRKVSRVYFDAGSRPTIEVMQMMHKTSEDQKYAVSPTPSQVTTFSVMDMLEADPFDYEIVNIDEDLLAVPMPEVDEMYAENETEIKTESVTLKSRTKIDDTDVQGSLNRQESVTSEDIPVKNHYKGTPNAFMIELFSLRDDVHESHAFDLLEGAFEVMKDYEYCIIKVPLEEPAFSLLQHFCYIPTNGDVCTDFALYVAHRSSIFGKIRVRDAEVADIPQIAQLMNDVDGNDTIWTVEDMLIREERNRVYVLLSGQKVVGFGILEPPEQIDFIRTRFLLESYHIHKYHQKHRELDCGFTTLKTVMVYRVFEQHFRFFARDMMRLSGCNSLLWLTAYRNKVVAYKANCLASVMIPLMPRKIDIDCVETLELKRIALLSKNISAFATWFLSKKFCSIPMQNVNARIVVVGASRTALAFLNKLLFGDSCTYLLFNNVTLVSPTSLPHIRNKKYSSAYMFRWFNTSSDKFIKSVPYTYYVNIVQGHLVEIDKKLNYITVSTGGKIYYDYLILAFGKQYQPPDYFVNILKQEDRLKDKVCQYECLDVPKVHEDIHIATEHLPYNAFIVNSFDDAARAISFVSSFSAFDYSYFDNKIVVYGATIHAYCCISALLDINVPPENIVFVEPFPPEDETKMRVPIFCNYYVDQTIQEVLKNLNITVYRSYYFLEWFVDSDNYVTQVDFLSCYHKISLECSAFFYYGKKGINPQAFVAIAKSGLAYNDGVLIDHEFRTKNPNVYAAGPAARYHGKYFAEHKDHKYYDSYEIGEKLGEIILNKLDPLFKEKKKKSSDSRNETSPNSSLRSKSDTTKIPTFEEDKSDVRDLPELTKPRVTNCTLPGGLQYLEVRPPGTKNPHYYVQSLHYNGYILETFKKGYFKLHLDTNLVVDGITCLSPVTYNLEKFKNLYGKSTNILNNVYVKFLTKRIDDFYEYFRQSWAQFLYIDQVDELFALVREVHPKEEIKHAVHKDRLNKFEESNKQKHMLRPVKSGLLDHLRPNLESTNLDVMIKYLLEWIDQNDIVVPMYMHPSKSQYFMSDLKLHPAFKKSKKSVAKLIKSYIY